MDAEISDKFDALSIKRGAAVNTLFETALRRYVDWEVFAEGFGLIPISHFLWKTLMGRLTDAEARELGRQSGSDTSVEFITTYFHKFDLETVLQSFKIIGEGFMRNFKYTDHGSESQRTVILYHKAGPRVSAYYAGVLKVLCKRLEMDVKVEESEDQVIATLKTHKDRGSQKLP